MKKIILIVAVVVMCGCSRSLSINPFDESHNPGIGRPTEEYRLDCLEKKVDWIMEHEGYWQIKEGTVTINHSRYKDWIVPFLNTGYKFKTWAEIYEEEHNDK